MSSKTKTAALYLRVSKDRQTLENQRLELEAVAQRRGWTIATIYGDDGISGAKGRDKRPGLDQMLKDATRRKFDVVMAWSIDRVGRSLLDLLNIIQHLESVGVDIYLDQQNIDTTTPQGKLLFQVTGAFAEYERHMITQRIHAGLARAKTQGKVLGRPKVDGEIEAKAKKALQAGKGIRKVARELGIGNGTVERIKAEMAGAAT